MSCFFKDDIFCFRNLKNMECDPKCEDFIKAECSNCMSFVGKNCKGRKTTCKDFKRRKGWVWDLD